MADDAPTLANAHLGRNVNDVGICKTRDFIFQKLEEISHLPSSFELARTQLAGVCRVHGLALRVANLGHIRTPFARVFLRSQNGPLSRKSVTAWLLLLNLCHPLVDGLKRPYRTQCRLGIDTSNAEHEAGKQAAAVSVSQLVRHARKFRHIGIARAIDEVPGLHRAAARFGFQHQG